VQEFTGMPKVYHDDQQMLAQEQFGIVVFCPGNARHAKVAKAVAARGRQDIQYGACA
jgi:predicted dehydrogenase